MRLWCRILTFAILVVVLAQAWAMPIYADLKGSSTILVDGITCTLPDAIRAANTDTTIGGCVGSPGVEAISLEADSILTEASPFAATVGGAEAGLPDITSTILIAGNDHRIERDSALTCQPDGPTDFRLFNVSGTGSLTLTGVTLRGGCVAPGDGIQARGGAIHLEGGTLALNGVAFEGHRVIGTEAGSAGAVGGALYCSNASITTITDSIFSDNLVQGTDGRATSTNTIGGAGYFDQCQVGNFEQSSIIGNMAVGSTDNDGSGDGGGLAFFDSTVAALRHLSILDNVAQGGDSNVGGSSDTAEGGGLLLTSSTVELFTHMTFLRNQARAGNGSVGSGNRADGGALLVSGGSLSIISQSHFEDNLALGGDSGGGSSPGNCEGGAIRVQGSAVVAGIEDSLFRGNACRSGQEATSSGVARAQGGAIALASGEISTIERVTFSENQAVAPAGSASVGTGGAIYVAGGTISLLASSTFDSNRAVGSADTTPGDPGGEGRGGALAIFSEVTMIRGNTFVDNEAVAGLGDAGSGTPRGGAIWTSESSPVALGGNLFSGNLAVLADGTATPEDCREDGSGLVSEGWNLVEAPGSCTFASTGDLTSVTTVTYTLADWGCESTLPDGSCVPTVAIDENSPAIDQSSCSDLSLLRDSRFFLRPFDLPAVADADDGCDIGAFEARDTDGDGFTEATDCAPENSNVHAVDLCGECGGDSSACLIFLDGFESGDTSGWG